MKKYLFSVMMAMSSIATFAYDFEVDGIYYNITSASQMTVEVTYGPNHTNGVENGGDYDGKNIVVPASVNYNGIQYAVTGIGTSAFSHEKWRSTGVGTYNIDSHLLSIILPNSIIYIGNSAFCRCVDLMNIKLPINLQTIEYGAFNGVGNILSLIIPSSVNTIGTFALPRSVKELIMLPYNPPTGFDSDFGATDADVFVPSRSKYMNSNYWKYNIVEMLTPSNCEFEYNGQVPAIEWTNNLSAYTMNVSDVYLEKDAGHHSTNAKADFFQGGNLAFSVEFPFEYTINKAKLNVRANNASRVYGEENPQFNISYSGFVNGENESVITSAPTISTTATKTSNVGEYSITISGGSAKNYEFVYEPGVLTVTKAPLSAKVNDASKVYGAQNPAFTIDYYGLKNNESTPAWTTSPTFQTDATQTSGVGAYTVKAVNGVPVNYDLGEITAGTLNITPAPLTIKANDAVRQYYSDDPTFSYTCNGFVNGENESVLVITPKLSTTATRTSSVGTYEIKVGETSSPNYSISFVNGTLTITPRTLIASVGNYERPYNEENPVFEVKYDGFVVNDDEKVLISKPEAKTTATKTSDVGTYPINVTGGSADNYIFSYTSGILTINKAEQTISWEQDLSTLSVDDQVELKAEASSGLPITYTMDQANIAEIYSAGNKYYLDCKGEGTFQIVAVQNGNKNYYSSTRIRKTVTIGNSSGINEMDNSQVKVQRTSYGIKVNDANVGDIIYVYTLDGQLQHSIKVDSKNVDIPLKKQDVYIIKIGGKIVKVGY